MKKILVTGSTDGIGFETAKSLVLLGHCVWVHGRSKEKVANSIANLKKAAPKAELHSFVCDLADFATIGKACEQLKTETTSLDVLINNAGIYMKNFETSKYGIEMTMTVNHLGPFLLTLSLHDLLKISKEARVINVSSIAHTRGHLSKNNFSLTENFDAYGTYAASKLANVLFTQKLAADWAADSISSYCLHPGVINTKLLRTGFGAIGADVASGAETSVYLALEKNIPAPSGSYFDNKKQKEVSAAARDKSLESDFWNWSLSVVREGAKNL